MRRPRTAAVHCCKMSAQTPRYSRGPYRTHKKTPRQTEHNRKRRKMSAQISECISEAEPITSRSPLPVDSLRLVSPVHGVDCVTASQDSPTALKSDLQADNSTQRYTSTFSASDTSIDPALFPGSLLTLSTSHLLMSSYICRHSLSNQAQEDLLHLLQLHVRPTTNTCLPLCMPFEKSQNHHMAPVLSPPATTTIRSAIRPCPPVNLLSVPMSVAVHL